MQDIVSTNKQPTMSSREIADLTGSRHSDVKRSAERLESDQILTSPLAQFDFEHRGNVYQEYRFNKRDSLVLVARLSPEYTARIVDRWQELEQQVAQPALPDFNNPVEAARAWADAKEAEQKALVSLESARPAVEFVGRYTAANGNVSLTQSAKDLQFKPRMFTKALERDGYLYRTGGNLTPYQRFIDQGIFSIKSGENSGHAFFQTVVTPKGKTYFANRYASELLE